MYSMGSVCSVGSVVSWGLCVAPSLLLLTQLTAADRLWSVEETGTKWRHGFNNGSHHSPTPVSCFSTTAPLSSKCRSRSAHPPLPATHGAARIQMIGICWVSCGVLSTRSQTAARGVLSTRSQTALIPASVSSVAVGVAKTGQHKMRSRACA